MKGMTPEEKKRYKVEAKGSLWVVTLQQGEYSDWSIDHYIFSGNSAEEVWEFVKIWASDGGTNEDETWSNKYGLIWEGKKHQFRQKEDEGVMRGDTGYGDAYEVEITRAHVIYVNP